MLLSRRFLLLFLLIAYFNTLLASQDFVKRPEVQAFVQEMVNTHDFKKETLLALMDAVVLQPQIINAMNAPYEKKPWDLYKQLFLNQDRIQGGIEFWKNNHAYLAQAEKKYGIPPQLIVAVIGVETLYGRKQGQYRVLDALATLAFDYPSRAPFFKKELKEFLLLCREHKVSPTAYFGSYAGAMGKPQFMPSSYRHYAVSFKEKGPIDLMHDDAAVIASVANYFYRHGWKVAQPVAQPAEVHGSAYKRIQKEQSGQYFQTKALAAVGIKPLLMPYTASEKLGFIEFMTSSGSEFWLTYPNFYVITRYNTSPQYALAVHLLSQALEQQWAQVKKSQQAPQSA